MKTILLRPWEARAAAEGRLGMIARPVLVPWKGRRKVAPYSPYYFADEQGRLVEHIDEPRIAGVDWSPWWPGDVLLCKETWAHYHTENDIRKHDGRSITEISDGLAGYRADGFDSIDDFRRHIKVMGDASTMGVHVRWDKWRPAQHMPEWAVRFRPRVEAVACKRCAEITDEDCYAMGVERIGSDGGVGRLDHSYSMARGLIAGKWRKDNPRHPWPDSWAWLATLRWEGR